MLCCVIHAAHALVCIVVVLITPHFSFLSALATDVLSSSPAPSSSLLAFIPPPPSPTSGCQACDSSCDAVCSRSGCTGGCDECEIAADISFDDSYTFPAGAVITIRPVGCSYPKIVVDGDLTIPTYTTLVAEPLPRVCTTTAPAAGAASEGAPGGSFWSAGGNTDDAAANTAPRDLLFMKGGSGGGNDENGAGGGRGGGVIDIDVTGTVSVHGSILANGEDASKDNAGGGSGGSVRIKCAALNGDTPGRIEANGGRGSVLGGAGAGGEIVIDSAAVSFPSAFMQARGGLGGTHTKTYVCVRVRGGGSARFP